MNQLNLHNQLNLIKFLFLSFQVSAPLPPRRVPLMDCREPEFEFNLNFVIKIMKMAPIDGVEAKRSPDVSERRHFD
jgi:hypothetical protein